jgi:hypothetical protein
VTRLFDRRAQLNVQGRDLTGLDFSFRVEKSLTKTQNSADIIVFGLSQDTRRFLQSQPNGVIVELRAGYADQSPLPRICLQQLRQVTSLREQQEWRTEISTGDSDQARGEPISFSLGPGTPFANAVKRITTELRAGVGNVDAVVGKIGGQYPDGVVVHGFGDDELDSMLRANGLEHSWQDGSLQVLPIGGALNASAVLLTETTGMVGSPELGMNKNAKTCKVRSLLNTDLVPGRVVRLQSDNVTGDYVVSKAVYIGDVAGQDWYVDLEMKVRG